MPKAKFYAVAKGRRPGIYNDWSTTQAQVTGFTGAIHKSFPSKDLAQAFILQHAHPDTVPPDPASSTTLSSESRLARKRKLESSVGSYAIDVPPTKYAKRALVVAPEDPSNTDPESIVVWTDGSSRGNGTGDAVAGLGLYFGPNDERNRSERLPGPRQTNQRAELTAIIRALQLVPRSAKVVVKSDSQYSINCFTLWHQTWQRNGWKNSKKQDVENKDLVQKGLALLQARQAVGGVTTLVKVVAHIGTHGNEEADQLANIGASMPERTDCESPFDE